MGGKEFASLSCAGPQKVQIWSQKRSSMPTDFRLIRISILIAVLFALVLALPKPIHAAKHLSGTYVCTKMEVAGKVKPCSAPSLELNDDGSYEIQSETGTYRIVANRWLVLSNKQDGKAHLVGNQEIIFEYRSQGKDHRITYHRKYDPPEGWISA